MTLQKQQVWVRSHGTARVGDEQWQDDAAQGQLGETVTMASESGGNDDEGRRR